VGTRFWKEFQVLLDGTLHRAETRLLRKVERGWVFTTYVWSRDGRSALATNNGVSNWERTGHSVPSRDQCVDCHGGRRDLVLGWDPVLLGPAARGVHFEDLLVDDDAGVPSVPTTPPGDAIEQAALGYLHVNCGVSCHNESVDARARDSALYLRLATGRSDSVLATPAVTTAINKLPTGNAPFFELPAPADGPFLDLLPGSPARSLLLARMLVRDHPAQMPPLASNRVDDLGAATVKAWIEHMTPERGYPIPVPEPAPAP
jgi:mono/diheme cytochrome c family protein